MTLREQRRHVDSAWVFERSERMLTLKLENNDDERQGEQSHGTITARMDRHCFLDVVRIVDRRLDRVSLSGVLAGPCPAGIVSSDPHTRNSAEYIASHRGLVSGKEFHCAAPGRSLELTNRNSSYACRLFAWGHLALRKRSGSTCISSSGWWTDDNFWCDHDSGIDF